MSTFADRLVEDFADKEFAHGYMGDHGNSRIAAQIKVLREQRGLTQAALAERAGMKQERVCALENVDYEGWTVKTLRKLAEAFDVHLKVAFVPFSEGIMDAVNLSREQLQVASREDDLQEFSLKLLSLRDGTWKALDGAHLAPVTTIVPKTPVDPSAKGWQEVVKVYGG